jgi:hypothetical protein
MDIDALERELGEAVVLLRKSPRNLIMAEHLVSNVLLKIRAALHKVMHDQLEIERAQYLKKLETDPDGRRIYERLPATARTKPAKAKNQAKPRKGGWMDQLDD